METCALENCLYEQVQDSNIFKNTSMVFYCSKHKFYHICSQNTTWCKHIKPDGHCFFSNYPVLHFPAKEPDKKDIFPVVMQQKYMNKPKLHKKQVAVFIFCTLREQDKPLNMSRQNSMSQKLYLYMNRKLSGVKKEKMVEMINFFYACIYDSLVEEKPFKIKISTKKKIYKDINKIISQYISCEPDELLPFREDFEAVPKYVFSKRFFRSAFPTSSEQKN